MTMTEVAEVDKEEYQICWKFKGKPNDRIFEGSVIDNKERAMKKVDRLNKDYPGWKYFIKTRVAGVGFNKTE
jgi:hypothetical protein